MSQFLILYLGCCCNNTLFPQESYKYHLVPISVSLKRDTHGRFHKRIAWLMRLLNLCKYKFPKQPLMYEIKCIPNYAAKQIGSWCSCAICTHLNQVISVHLVQNWPLSMQTNLIAKTIQKDQRQQPHTVTVKLLASSENWW